MPFLQAVPCRTAYAQDILCDLRDRTSKAVFGVLSSSAVAVRIGVELVAMDGISIADFGESELRNVPSGHGLCRKPNHCPQRRFLLGR
jgi:hypothetical protein